ncbi:MAG TPA: hypothetical protein VLK53_02950 [Gaiellaceae bacterium]|nr:hypothetical protein [Gaiellaceae bacterium]
MRGVRGVAVAVLALGLCVPVAFAAKGDPQKKITKAGQAHAIGASLHRADFPPTGWQQQPKQPKQKDESNPRCSYYNPDQSDLVEIGDYDSPDFDQADGSSISSSTGVFKTVAMGKTAYARVAKPDLVKCLAELFKKGAGATKTTIFSSAPLSFKSYGDQSTAHRIVASVKTPTAAVRVYLDVILVNKGRTDIAFLGLGIQKPLSTALEQPLVGKVTGRA